MMMTSYQGLSPCRTLRIWAGAVCTRPEPGLPRSIPTPPRRRSRSSSLGSPLIFTTYVFSTPAAQVVESPDGVQAIAQLREKLHHCRPLFGIAHRGDEAPGLVEHEVAEALGALQQLAVNADVGAGGIGLGAEFGDDLAVHLDAALGDQIFGVAATGHPGLGQDLLQTLELAG